MTGDTGGQNDRVRKELIGHRYHFPPLEIRLHHVYDDDSDGFLVWARLVRQDGTEAFAVISNDDAHVCKAVWGKCVIWMTRLRERRGSYASHKDAFAELTYKTRNKRPD